MFGLFHRKSGRKPPPPWVTWMMIGVVIYAMFSSQQQGSQVQRAVQNSSNTVKTHLNQFDAVTDKVLPNMVAAIRISEVKIGEGTPVVCGQTATIAYQAWLSEDKRIDDSASHDKPLSFDIGHGKVLPALERGVIGMQKGGRRTVFASPEIAYDTAAFKREDVPAGTTVKFDIELLASAPDVPASAKSAYRIIDTVENTGNMVLCGQFARAHVTVWSVGGKALYSSKELKAPVEFKTGLSEVFLGLEQGVIGMAPGSQRMLIVPPEFQKTMRQSQSSIDFRLPGSETVLVDVELLP